MFRCNASDIQDLSFKSYLDEISERFCPFLKPSSDSNGLLFSQYHISGSIEQISQSLFYFGIIHSEILRRARREEKNLRNSMLYSENIVVELDQDTNYDGNEVFGWAHWLLKLLYTEVGIMFGKFWVGEEDISRLGIPITIPNRNFLTIRSSLKKRDENFFRDSSHDDALKDMMMTAEDDLRNVFRKVTPSLTSIPLIGDIENQIAKHNLCEINSALIVSWVEQLKSSECYDLIKSWACKEYPL